MTEEMNKELEERMLKLMTQKEQDDYHWKKISTLMYSKFGHMSNKERGEHGVWFQDEQGMKDE